MAKNKQQKQKERERRVAKEKLEAVAQKRTQAKTANETKKPVSKTAELMKGVALPKTEYVAKTTKTAFSHRRTGS